MLTVVKVGSNILTRPDGHVNVSRLSAIVDQLAALHAAGHQLILVSSGAVACGRGETDGKKHKSRIFICDIFFGNFVRICLSPAPTEYFTPRGCLYGIGCITFCNLHGTGSVLDFICEKKDLV